MSSPSPWVVRFAPLVPRGGTVLDVACGAGRHLRWFLDRGHPVVGVDRDLTGVVDLADDPRVTLHEADLEPSHGRPPDLLEGQRFAGVIVTRYLHRPLLPWLRARLDDDGVLVYETFSVGQERLGRPRRPAFLLRSGELLDTFHRPPLRVVAYEDGATVGPPPAVLQRICVVRFDPIGPPPPLDPPGP